MVKRDPDDIISALSKNIKTEKAPILRFTFKRGGLWQPTFAKAHSRKAKIVIRNTLKAQAANEGQDQVWPLLVRLRSNEKQDKIRLNCQLREGKGAGFIESLLGVFRVNFFKKKGENEKKEIKTATKADPNSKTSLRNKKRTERNRERSKKRGELKKKARVQKLKTKLAK